MGCSGSTSVTPTPVPVKVPEVKSCGAARSQQSVAPNKASKFQWRDGHGWNDYDRRTDAMLKQAYLVGRKGAKFQVCSKTGLEEYQFSFHKGPLMQRNVITGKERQIRPPRGMWAPKEAVLPEGDFIVLTLTAAHEGKEEIEVANPRNKSETIRVSIPWKARRGQKIAVPIPAEGEALEDVAKRQLAMSTGAKLARGAGITAAAGCCVLGGVILGDHLAGGVLAEHMLDGARDSADAFGEWAAAAAGDAADLATDAAGAVSDFAEDVGEWLGDAGEDVGDWICTVF